MTEISSITKQAEVVISDNNVEETVGMLKLDRETHFDKFYSQIYKALAPYMSTKVLSKYQLNLDKIKQKERECYKRNKKKVLKQQKTSKKK